MHNKLSIIIVNYHCEEMINNLIADFTNKEYIEIVIVDNSNSYKTLFENIKVISLGYNAGFGRACNFGIKNATNNYILLLNPDCKTDSHTINCVLNEYLCLEKEINNLGLYTIQCINDKQQKTPTTSKHIPSLLNSITNNNILTSFIKEKTKEKAKFPYTLLVHGSFMLFNKIIDNQYFDEDFFMYGEDSEFSVRIANKGYKNYYSEKYNYIHLEGQTYSSDKLRIAQSTLSKWLFIRKTKGAMYINICFFFLIFNLFFFCFLKIKNRKAICKKRPLISEINLIKIILSNYFNILFFSFRKNNKHKFLKYE